MAPKRSSSPAPSKKKDNASPAPVRPPATGKGGDKSSRSSSPLPEKPDKADKKKSSVVGAAPEVKKMKSAGSSNDLEDMDDMSSPLTLGEGARVKARSPAHPSRLRLQKVEQ